MDESKNNLIDNESKFIEFSGLNRELYITLLRNRSAKCKLIEYTNNINGRIQPETYSKH